MRTVKLAELAADQRWSINGGPFGSKLVSKDYRDEGVPVIRGANLPGGRWFSHDDLVFVSEEKADELLANNAYPGDVIFTQRGTLGQVGLIPLDSPFKRYVISQSQMKLTVNRGIADSRWVYYYFRQESVVESIKARAVTSGVPHINLGTLRDFEIALPDLDIQRASADCLVALDSQLENCRQQIALIEAAARLIYMEWFVRLWFPEHEKIKRVDGLPVGWQLTNLGIACEYINRGVPPTYDDSSSKRVVNQKCIRDGQLDLGLARTLANDVPDDKWLRPGDVLINSTGTGTLGRVAQVREAMELVTVDTHVTIVRPKPGVAPWFFGLQLLALQSYFEALGEGATNQTELKRERIRETRFLLPTAEIMLPFDAIVAPMIEQILVLTRQAACLREARDLLLPRLISGQLRL